MLQQLLIRGQTFTIYHHSTQLLPIEIYKLIKFYEQYPRDQNNQVPLFTSFRNVLDSPPPLDPGFIVSSVISHIRHQIKDSLLIKAIIFFHGLQDRNRVCPSLYPFKFHLTNFAHIAPFSEDFIAKPGQLNPFSI